MMLTAWAMSDVVGVPPFGMSAANTALVPPARSIARRGCVACTPNIVAYRATRITASAASGRQGR
jgi:hypothetical protein